MTVQLCAHASTPHKNWHPLHKQKPKQAFPVISAPSESIWWIECLEVLPLTDGARILNVAQNGTWHHSEDMCTHLHKKNTVRKQTHLEALTKTDTAMHLEDLNSICWKIFFSPSWEFIRVVPGNKRVITGLVLSQGCGLLSLKFPPPQMKVAVVVQDGNQVFQL